MTTVTPGAVEVTKADRLAALNHHGFKEEADLSYWGNGSDMRQVDETAALLARHRIAATPPDALQTVVEAWQPIDSAPKDRTIIWAIMRDDIYPGLRPGREDLKTWNGVQIALRHPGVCDDGFDMGWNVAAPVGHGGFPDEWIAGWRPLPKPPALSLAGGDV